MAALYCTSHGLSLLKNIKFNRRMKNMGFWYYRQMWKYYYDKTTLWWFIESHCILWIYLVEVPGLFKDGRGSDDFVDIETGQI